MRTARLHWLLFFIVSTGFCVGHSMFSLHVDEHRSIYSLLEDFWRWLKSMVSWFDSGGYDVFDMCPELEPPDWDQFEPETKRCERLSDLILPEQGTWDQIQSSVSSYVSTFTSAAMDTSSQITNVDIYSWIPGMDMWKNPSLFQAMSMEPIMTFFGQAWKDISVPDLSQYTQAWQDISVPDLSKYTPDLPSRDNLETFIQLYMSNFVLYNNTSLPLIATAAVLTALFVICSLLTDDYNTCSEKRVTFSSNERQPERDVSRQKRLARIKKDGRKRKSPRKTNASKDSYTDQLLQAPGLVPETISAACCLQDSTRGGIDDDALRYIVGSKTDTTTDAVKERIRAALQVIARHEEEECCRPSDGSSGQVQTSSRDCSGSVVYDIRYKDQLPSDVMDVLFCIDPTCKHDHARYEMRGCKVVVKPENYRELEESPRSKVRPKIGGKSPADGISNNQPESIQRSNAGTSNDGSSNGTSVDTEDKVCQVDDLLDEETQRSNSFPDWTAPKFDDDSCPYCQEAKGTSPMSDDLDSNMMYSMHGSSSDLTSDDENETCMVNKGTGTVRYETSHIYKSPKRMAEFFEDDIGPPQANSSFQGDEDMNEGWRSPIPMNEQVKAGSSPPKKGRRRGKNTRSPEKHTPDSPTIDGTRNGAARSSPTYGRRNQMVKKTLESVASPSRPSPMRSTGETSSNVTDDNDSFSLASLDENELSLTSELNNSLDESKLSMDLNELNKSLSYYGDVSMVELAASWVVQNVLERAGKLVASLTPSLTPTKIKESILDISTEITELLDLIE